MPPRAGTSRGPTHFPFWARRVSLLSPISPYGPLMALHSRSTFPSSPSPPLPSGWRSEGHCPRGFARRVTPSHAWVGAPGHHRAYARWRRCTSVVVLLCGPFDGPTPVRASPVLVAHATVRTTARFPPVPSGQSALPRPRGPRELGSRVSGVPSEHNRAIAGHPGGPLRVHRQALDPPPASHVGVLNTGQSGGAILPRRRCSGCPDAYRPLPPRPGRRSP